MLAYIPYMDPMGYIYIIHMIHIVHDTSNYKSYKTGFFTRIPKGGEVSQVLGAPNFPIFLNQPRRGTVTTFIEAGKATIFSIHHSF